MCRGNLNVPFASQLIFDGLLMIVPGSFLSRAAIEAGEGNGLEVWRLIYKEWRNKSPLVMETRACENQIRCNDVLEVGTKLTEWENCGNTHEECNGHNFLEQQFGNLKLPVHLQLTN